MLSTVRTPARSIILYLTGTQHQVSSVYMLTYLKHEMSFGVVEMLRLIGQPTFYGIGDRSVCVMLTYLSTV